MKIKATHSSPAAGDVTVFGGRHLVAWSRSLKRVRVGSSRCPPRPQQSCRPWCAALPGAGAKQEPRLFRDLPELLSTAANRPVLRWGFSISAGQQSVEITRQVKGSQALLRATAITLWSFSLLARGRGEPHPGFRFRLVGMGGAAAGDHEGEPRPRWPWALWLSTVTSLAVGLECVFLIFMAGHHLT
jgi:hypothetical protein